MTGKRQTGFLFIADISGYTELLTQVELEHALDIVKHLLDTLVKNVLPPLILAKLEGDALFFYAPQGSFLLGQTCLEAIERFYNAFLISRESLSGRMKTCGCKGCRLTPSLDLKFVAHHGTFLIQSMKQGEELSGPDVILVHRLLKNSVTESTGLKAYAFLTEACFAAIPFGDLPTTMRRHSERYEHLGEVRGSVHDVSNAWERQRDRHRMTVDEKDSWFHVDAEYPVPQSVLWECLVEPGHLAHYCEMEKVTLQGLKEHRVAPGTSCSCIKGGKEILQTFVDWNPFDYFTVETATEIGLARTTVSLTPSGQGTRARWLVSRPERSVGFGAMLLRLFGPLMRLAVKAEIKRESARLRQLINEEINAGKVLQSATT